MLKGKKYVDFFLLASWLLERRNVVALASSPKQTKKKIGEIILKEINAKQACPSGIQLEGKK